jgi:hypothetical protein
MRENKLTTPLSTRPTRLLQSASRKSLGSRSLRVTETPHCAQVRALGRFYPFHLSRRVTSIRHRRWRSELVVCQGKRPDHSPHSMADNSRSSGNTADNSHSSGNTADNTRSHLGNSHRSRVYDVFRQPRPGSRTGRKHPRTPPLKLQRNVLSYRNLTRVLTRSFENLAIFDRGCTEKTGVPFRRTI